MYIVEFPFIFFKKWHYSIFFITVREELIVLKKNSSFTNQNQK